MHLSRRGLLQVAASSAALGAAMPAVAASSVRRHDELWFLNSACVPGGRLTPAHNRCWSASRMSPGTPWQGSSLNELLSESGDGRITVVFVHGYRVNMAWAMQCGWEIYQGLVQACPTSPPPIRYVIWKWPSEKGFGRPVVDGREKAAIANLEGYKLASVLGQIPSHTPLGLVGFSYGPRVITGALHLLGGGASCGLTLNAHYQHQARSVLWAAGLHNDWLAPGHRHGRALHASDAMLNLYNCYDPVLKHYPRLEPRTRPAALGYTGIPRSWLGPEGYRLQQRNVGREVNRLHLTRNYSSSPSVMASTRQYLLWQNV